MSEISIDDRDEMISHLATGSDRMLDAIVAKRLNEIVGRPHDEVKKELRGIIADSQYAALTSDFVIRVLYIMLNKIGWTEEDEKVFTRAVDTKSESLRTEYKLLCWANA